MDGTHWMTSCKHSTAFVIVAVQLKVIRSRSSPLLGVSLGYYYPSSWSLELSFKTSLCLTFRLVLSINTDMSHLYNHYVGSQVMGHHFSDMPGNPPVSVDAFGSMTREDRVIGYSCHNSDASGSRPMPMACEVDRYSGYRSSPAPPPRTHAPAQGERHQYTRHFEPSEPVEDGGDWLLSYWARYSQQGRNDGTAVQTPSFNESDELEEPWKETYFPNSEPYQGRGNYREARDAGPANTQDTRLLDESDSRVKKASRLETFQFKYPNCSRCFSRDEDLQAHKERRRH